MGDRGDWLTDSRGRRLPHGSWPPTRTAPAGLETVRQFLNTRNPHTEADILGTIGELRSWLTERSMPTANVDGDALRQVHMLRDVLLALAIANAEATPGEDEWRQLSLLAEQHPVCFTFEGTPSVRSLVSGWSEVVTAILGSVARARLDGSWALLKACRDPTCRWVIYDRSKNHSASWCSTGTCGGKARARSYRARRRGDEVGASI